MHKNLFALEFLCYASHEIKKLEPIPSVRYETLGLPSTVELSKPYTYNPIHPREFDTKIRVCRANKPQPQIPSAIRSLVLCIFPQFSNRDNGDSDEQEEKG